MFKKYEKIPASLHFTLHTVNLKRKMSSYFKLSFQRGNSYHGATDLVKPDDKGILKFEASYDTKCTLYLSKSDATTKPKKLKIILHRFTDQNTSKIYGKIVIDVSKYYGSKSVSYEEFEMESGRSIPPVLGISIIIKQAGKSVVGAIDQSDKSFIDENAEKIPVSDWDKTEIDTNDVLIQRHTDSKKKKKDKKRKTDVDSSESSEKSEKSEFSEKSEKSEVSEKDKEEKPKKKKSKKKKTEAKQESESEKEDKPHQHKSKVDGEKESTRESKVSAAAPASSDADKKEAFSVPDISDSDDKEEAKEKEDKPKKKKSKKKKTEIKQESDSDKSDKEERESSVKKERDSSAKSERQSTAKKDEDSDTNDSENSDKPEKKKKTKKSKKSEKQPDSQSTQTPAERSAQPTAEQAEQPESKQDKQGDDSKEDDKVRVRSTASTPIVIEKTKEDKKKGPSELDIEQMITSVIARSWSSNGRQIYLDAKRRIPLPAAVFTIFAVLNHTKFFSTAHVDNKEFASAMDTFFDEYENAPICDNCTSDQRFVTTLCLLLLVNRNANELGFAPERVKKFTTRLLPFLNDYARQIIAPLLINFEVLCNRFATARFEVDPLLEDFREVLDGIKSSLMYTTGINDYLLKHFMQLLDVKMLNKLLANPARFVFSKAIIWNSFLTAFLSAEKFELPLLRQAVWTLVMAVNMTSDNEPGEEVRENLCPTLDPKIIVFLLKNYKPDEMMPTAINWKKVADAVHVEDVGTYDPVRPTDIDDYELAGQKLKIQVWNQVQIESSLLKLYPYLAAYSVASP
ncbi:hypothetical protein M9Y10_008649 [Tritrichomonas musculus]|uniref:C2 NT-type domain-containing protein n=1 Tax=Tritrichomonas musculus TaxID=1915356 RepID=A0ABR2IYP3_9EUKA